MLQYKIVVGVKGAIDQNGAPEKSSEQRTPEHFIRIYSNRFHHKNARILRYHAKFFNRPCRQRLLCMIAILTAMPSSFFESQSYGTPPKHHSDMAPLVHLELKAFLHLNLSCESRKTACYS